MVEKETELGQEELQFSHVFKWRGGKNVVGVVK